MSRSRLSFGLLTSIGVSAWTPSSPTAARRQSSAAWETTSRKRWREGLRSTWGNRSPEAEQRTVALGRSVTAARMSPLQREAFACIDLSVRIGNTYRLPRALIANKSIENSQKLSISLHDSRQYSPNNHSSCPSVLGKYNFNRNRSGLRISGGKSQTL